MRIHVYSPVWNEEFILPYYLRHYLPFAEKIVFFDNGSTDGTLALAREAGVEVRAWDTGGFQDEARMRDLKNHCWKESRGQADWVIVCDIDEIVYHPRLIEYLARMKEEGITIPHPPGFQLVSNSPPSGQGQVYDEIRLGKYCREYESKMCVFDPNAVVEINYSLGAHEAHPYGDVKIRWPSELKLLHCKFFGVDYVYEACRKARSHLHPKAKELGWWDYSWSREESQRKMDLVWHNAQVVMP
jgi:glycosyltransferase involved in cell wall biosynthesis